MTNKTKHKYNAKITVTFERGCSAENRRIAKDNINRWICLELGKMEIGNYAKKVKIKVEKLPF